MHISAGQPPNLATTNDLIGTFKTVPNNAGAGIFNFRDIIESFVSSDNLTAFRAVVKGEDDEEKNGGTYPLHIIDKDTPKLSVSSFIEKSGFLPAKN